MVSLRRRRLLGLCAGRSSFLTPLPRFPDNLCAPVSTSLNARSISVHPLPSDDVNQKMEEKIDIKVGAGVLNVSASSSPKEQRSQPYPEQPVKRRKRHRRKPIQNQEPCVMRGVYFKNMKWQAAIKVDKKQIHLGTVGSQEEAARLYDRAAFMCRREPNFQLSEEEKQELRKYKWDEFLAMTRSTINHKKGKRRNGGALHKNLGPAVENDQFYGDQEETDFPVSDPDSSSS